jgi:aminoglycoside N3'-acetyltransferase
VVVSPQPWSRRQIADELRRLGVAPGDVVMVHASLRAVGPVAGGADGVLDALTEAIGPGGTLFFPIGARDDWGWVNERPEDEREALLADAEPFDARTTPADPDVGVLAEVFRTRPGTTVSDHPEGRFAACGPLARSLTDDVPWDDYHGEGSPLARFVDGGGRVLRLGADPDTVTVIHLAEHRVELPSKRRVRRHRRVTGPDGPSLRVVEALDDNHGIVEHDGDEFSEILDDHLATGRAVVGQVGGANAELIEASDIVRFAVSWMGERFAGG